MIFIDNDPRRCHEAEQAGFAVVYGNALQDRTMRRARLELVGTAVGATFNENLNSQFIRYVRQSFRVPNGLVAVSALHHEDIPDHVTRHQSGVLFDGAHDQARWDVRWRRGEIAIRSFVFQPPKGSTQETSSTGSSVIRQDGYVILTTERRKMVGPRRLRDRPKVGDRAAIAIHLGSEAETLEQLEASGWRPSPANEVGSTIVPSEGP